MEQQIEVERAKGWKILAAGTTDGEPVTMVEHADGTCAIRLGLEAEREIYRWAPGHVEECTSLFLRFLRNGDRSKTRA